MEKMYYSLYNIQKVKNEVYIVKCTNLCNCWFIDIVSKHFTVWPVHLIGELYWRWTFYYLTCASYSRLILYLNILLYNLCILFKSYTEAEHFTIWPVHLIHWIYGDIVSEHFTVWPVHLIRDRYCIWTFYCMTYCASYSLLFWC